MIFDLICLFPSVNVYKKINWKHINDEDSVKCAVVETAIHGAEPELAEVKNYFTCLENKKL